MAESNISQHLLSSCLEKFEELSFEEFSEKLIQFQDSPLGKALQECINSKSTKFNMISATQPRIPIKLSLQAHSVSQEHSKTNEVLHNISLLVAVFLQVNSLGPLMNYISDSDACLEERHVACERREDINYLPLFEKKKHFWSTFFLGHPDDRVGISQSSSLSGGVLFTLFSQLESDGEGLSESIRAIPYLWSAIQLACSAVSTSSDPCNFILRICVLADVAFLWQQALENSPNGISCTLQYWALYNPLTLASLAHMLPGICCRLKFLDSPIYAEQPCVFDIKSNLSHDQAKHFFESISCTEKFTFFLQLSLRLSYFGYSELSMEMLKCIVAPLIDFKFSFSSFLGKRREHQQTMLPQLILQTESRGPENIQHTEDSKNTYSTVQQIGLKEFDPTSDILPCVQTSQGVSAYSNPLTTPQVLVLLGLCYAIYKNAPKGDEVAMEELRSVVERCLYPVQPLNPLILTSCLWFRCHTEFYRIKTHDRALHQLNALCDEFKKKTQQCFYKSISYVLMIWYPLRHLNALYLGRRLMQSGFIMSARDLFVELWMWEDAAECLIAAGRKSLALDLIRERLAVRPSPRLLCALGDALQNPEHYQEAWSLSNQRYTRAKRSLGNYYLARQNWIEASKHYTEALKINPCFDQTWFSLGCCLMKLKDVDQALHAFSRVVTLQPDNGEAWANAAALHFQKNNCHEAFTCIKEAVRFCRTEWRMWDTYIKVAVKLKNSEHCILGANALLEMGHKSKISNWVFGFLSAHAQFLISELSSSPNEKTDTVTLQRELNRICNFFDQTQRNFISNNVALYMCFASIYSALQDGAKEFPLRLKELRCATANLPTSMSTEEARDYTTDLLCQVLQHLQTGFRLWCKTSNETTVMHQRTTSEELCQLLMNLAEKLEKSFSQDSRVMKTLNETSNFFSEISSQLTHDRTKANFSISV